MTIFALLLLDSSKAYEVIKKNSWNQKKKKKKEREKEKKQHFSYTISACVDLQLVWETYTQLF